MASIDFPYTRRYVGTIPGVYQFEQLFRWAMGPMATTLAIIGVVLMVVLAIRQRRIEITLPLAFLGLQSIVILLPEIKFLRYQIPIIPVLSIATGLTIWMGYQWLARRYNAIPAVAYATVCLVGIGLWTTAFMNIYHEEQPRITASKWIYANIPAGSVISSESWDDQIPVQFGPMLTGDDMRYTNISLDIYGDRPQEEVSDYLFTQLSQLDYVILSSNRLKESVATEPWRYPVQIEYYNLLDSGELGFTLVADFQVKPEVGPISFDDGLADESWVNYDHPRVLIYKNTGMVDRATWDKLFASAVAAPWTVSRLDPEKDSLMLDVPVDQLTVTSDFRWSEQWTHNSGVALAFWVALMVLFSFVGYPWVRLLFPRAPDGGTGLARTATMLIAGWLTWFLASVKLIVFSAVWSWIILAVVAVLGWVLWWFLADRKRRFPRIAITGAEVAFWAVFALFLFYRWVNPDSWHPIWGGEKPMEFAHLNATLRSAHFPPYDPWFSGGYINYYYYGLYLVAYCIKLTGIPAEIAFNLAQPMMMAMGASCAYSLASALTATRKRAAQSVVTGLLAATLLLLIGNLIDFVKVLYTWPAQVVPNFDHWFWDPSRAIPNTITEFPYFTGTYADLHAHGINVPITLVLLSVLLTVARDPNLTTLAILRPRLNKNTFNSIVRLGALGLFVGSVATTNSWDAAEYLAFLAVGVFMTTIGLKPFPIRLVVTGVLTAVAGAIALAMFLPFYAKYVALFNQIGRTTDKTSPIDIFLHFGGFFLILGAGATAMFLNRQQGRVFKLYADPVLPMAIVGAGLAVAIATNWETRSDPNTVKIAVILACLVLSAPIAIVTSKQYMRFIGDLGIGVALMAFLFEVALTLDDRGTFALCFAFFLLGGAIWIFSADRAERMIGALIACAAGMVGAIEFVYLQDNLAGGSAYRMNTVFKFYNQVWVMFAVASAAVLGKALRNAGWLAWAGVDAPEDEPWWADEDPAEYANWLEDDFDDDEVLPVSGGSDDPEVPLQPASDSLQPYSDPEPLLSTGLPSAVVPEEPIGDPVTAPVDTESAAPLAPVAELTDEELDDEWQAGTWARSDRTLMNSRWAKATVVIGALVIFMSLFYPVLATASRLEQRFAGHPSPGTLNSYDWMRYGTITGWNGQVITFNGDYDAIYWFINNVKGSPVLMEAAIGPYRGNGSRFSINTGLPDVIGWDNHEYQQRYPEDIGPRQQDVETFYNSTNVDEKLQILAKYDVSYVIVGDVERYWGPDGQWADPAGITSIESMDGKYLEVAFQSGDTTVYRVIKDALPPVATDTSNP